MNSSRVLYQQQIGEQRTVKAMEALEKYYGKDITTRNWNTIERIAKKLENR